MKTSNDIIKANAQEAAKKDALAKKIQKIKDLKAELERLSAAVPEAMAKYGAIISQHQPTLHQLYHNKLTALDDYFSKIKLTKAEKKAVEEYMCREAELFLKHSDGDDTEMLAIFQKYAHQSYEDYQNQVLEMSVSLTKHMFDIEEDVPEGLTKEEVFDFLAEQLQKNQQNAPAPKKTKAELNREKKQKEKEELQNKSLRSIYLGLMKAFHPDTETDPQRKVEKEEISKTITKVYNQKDLHELLQLEIKYMEQEVANIENVAKEKIKLYTAMFNEQINKLEYRIYEIKNENYEVYTNMCTKNARPDAFLKRTVKEINEEIETLEIQINSLKNWNSPLLKKSILTSIKQSIQQDDAFFY